MSPDLMAFFVGASGSRALAAAASGHPCLFRGRIQTHRLGQSDTKQKTNVGCFCRLFRGGQNHVIRYANGAVLPLCGAG